MLRIGFRKGIQNWRGRFVVALLLSAHTDPIVGLDSLRSSRILGLNEIVGGNRIVPFAIVFMDSRDPRLGNNGNFRRRILGKIVLESLQSVWQIAQSGLGIGLLDDGETSEPSIRIDCQRFVEIAERFRSVVQSEVHASHRDRADCPRACRPYNLTETHHTRQWPDRRHSATRRSWW